MYETFNLGLHAPISELHFAELVGTHDCSLTGVLVDVLNPVLRQRTPLGFNRLVQFGVFLHQVLVRRNVVFDDVYGVCGWRKNR